jgi:hypothetical protein
MLWHALFWIEFKLTRKNPTVDRDEVDRLRKRFMKLDKVSILVQQILVEEQLSNLSTG